MAFNLCHTISAPFSEYPLTRRFENREVPRIIIFLSILFLLILIPFNVYTQGQLAQTETILSPHWYPKNDTCNCQPATIDVGNTYFTNKALENHFKDGDAIEPKTDYRGDFGWTIEKGINTRTNFQYQEGNLNCNVTDVLLYFDFVVGTFWYRICTRCSTPRVESGPKDNYLSLCVSYDSYEQSGPIFTEKKQAALRMQIYSFHSLFKELHFPPNTLPGTAFPPDYSLKDSTVTQTSIPNRDIVGWSAGMDNFNYTPATKYSDLDLSHIHTNSEAQGNLYLSVNDTKPIGFSEGVLKLLSRGHFSSEFIALGIGYIHPFPPNLTSQGASRLPNPLPKYFNLTQSIMALMLDAAVKDVHDQVLSVSYLCTVTKMNWKTFFPMLAMIIGNCSGIFTAGLTAMICIARRFEIHTDTNKTESQKKIENESPNSGKHVKTQKK